MEMWLSKEWHFKLSNNDMLMVIHFLRGVPNKQDLENGKALADRLTQCRIDELEAAAKRLREAMGQDTAA